MGKKRKAPAREQSRLLLQQSVCDGGDQLLENLLDSVPFKKLVDAVKDMEGLRYWDATENKHTHFEPDDWEETLEDCLKWASEESRGDLRRGGSDGINALAAVRLWTSNLSYVVTSKLRDRERTKNSLQPVCAYLRLPYKGLHALPARMVYRGKLYRGERSVRDSWDEKMKIGETCCFYAPTAFTNDPQVVEEFKGKKNAKRTVYVIEDGVGYHLSEISIEPAECEVLLEGVTRFKVVSNNNDDKLVGESRCYYRATLELQLGMPMLAGSPVRGMERDLVAERMRPMVEEAQKSVLAEAGLGQALSKKDFTFAPIEKSAWLAVNKVDEADFNEADLDDAELTKRMAMLEWGFRRPHPIVHE